MNTGESVTAIVDNTWYRLTVTAVGEVDGEDGGLSPYRPAADRFVPPMKNIEKAWYEATQRLGRYNVHPGRCQDWNLETGGDSDLGEPLVAPFNGLVINAENYGSGWGNIIRILGRTPEGEVICWKGAHLKDVSVSVGDIVEVGAIIGTIGKGYNGEYAAHLHEEITVGPVAGAHIFASDARYDFQQPSQFYVEHGVDAALIDRLVKYDGK